MDSPSARAAPRAYRLAEGAFLAFWRRLEAGLGSTGRGIGLMLSPAGVPYWAHLLLFLSVFTSWLTSPVQGGIKGRSAPLFGIGADLLDGVTRPWRLLSVGTLLLVLLAFGWVTRRLGRRPSFYYTMCGGIALFLAVSWLASLAFARPEALAALVDQNAQLERIKEFDNTHVHGNIGVIKIELLLCETLSDTLTTLFRVAGFGVWFALLSAWAFLRAGARLDTHPRRPLLLRTALGATAAFVLVVGLPAGIADFFRHRADVAFYRGDYHGALRSYRRAARIDARFWEQDSFMLSLAESAFRSGERSTAEARYFLGASHLDYLNYASAAQEFEQGLARVPGGSPAARAFRRRLRDTWRLNGNLLYSQARIYSSIVSWERAFSFDPASVEIPYYLARAYYLADGPNQDRAIQTNQFLMKRVRDKIFRSDIYCNLGEAYARKGLPAESRVNYERSLDMYDFVKDINYRAQRGMIGL